MKTPIYANDFAPRDGKMTVFFKKVPRGKSDGFVVTVNGEVFVIDAGHTYDRGTLDYLQGVRNEWLASQSDRSLSERPVKLAFHLIVSHPHGDHINALPELLKSPLLDALSVYAPTRSHLGSDVDGALPSLTECENKLDELEESLNLYGHTSRSVRRIPFGECVTLPMKNSNGTVELFGSPIDWSTGKEFDFIRANVPATYGDNTELANANGILNSNSLWIKINHRKQSVLFTGDQRDAPEFIQRFAKYYGEERFRCDVLKYLHHGEKNYSPYLMKITAPKITVFTIASGKEDPRSLAMCQKESKLYCVGEGDLTLTLDGTKIQSSGISPKKIE